jgi:hypothetical protein
MFANKRSCETFYYCLFIDSVLFGGGGGGLLGAVGGNVLGGTKPLVEPIAFGCGGARGGDIDGRRGRQACCARFRP